MATITHDNPRTILKTAQADVSDDAAVQLVKQPAVRKIVGRLRSNKVDHGVNPDIAIDLIIPEDLQYTFNDEIFYFDDTGPNSHDRIILFTTDRNINLLKTVPDWYCDGTFKVCPSIFKQVYTIHIVYKGKCLPVAYFLCQTKRNLRILSCSIC